MTMTTPDRYMDVSAERLAHDIESRRRELGDALLILAHHYQRDEIVQHADFVGDSLRLSMRAADASRTRNVKWIVFCGVHFMAETADLLTDERVTVILPNLGARCPMAEMAQEDDVSHALGILTSDQLQASPRPLVPIAYVNSSAAVKALVGEHGGACCTSANAERIMRWALNGGERQGQIARVLFLPDEHLGRNVCNTLGIEQADQILWDPGKAHRGSAPAQMRKARVIHWKGHCYVHTRFRPRDVAHARAAAPRDGLPIRIVVHPECTRDVVADADESVSTESMVKMLENAEPNSRWAIGTESHLVQRLARRSAQRGIDVRMLGRAQPMCGAMLHIAPPDLLWVLDNLVQDCIVNRVSVAPATRCGARLALERMLRLSA